MRTDPRPWSAGQVALLILLVLGLLGEILVVALAMVYPNGFGP
jgi:hypothetical protein